MVGPLNPFNPINLRWLDGEKAPVPNIGDGESPLSTGLENIEKIYDKCLQSLFEVGNQNFKTYFNCFF